MHSKDLSGNGSGYELHHLANLQSRTQPRSGGNNAYGETEDAQKLLTRKIWRNRIRVVDANVKCNGTGGSHARRFRPWRQILAVAGFVLLTTTLAEAQERPWPPTITSVESGRGTIKVSWTWGADNGCNNPRNVRIQYAASQTDFGNNTYIGQYDGQYDNSGTGASHMFTGVAVGSYAVRMFQGGYRSNGTSCGLGMESNYKNVTVTQLNNAPVIAGPDTVALIVGEDIAPGTAIRQFSATDEDGDTIIWSLEGQDAAPFTVNLGGWVGTGSETSFDYESGNTAYTLKLKAGDEFGGSDVVTINVTVTDEDEPPGTPAAPTVATSGASLVVNWSAPANAGRPPISDYDLRYREGTAGSWAEAGHAGAATSTRISNLKENTSYEVQVRAWNVDGESGWSPSGSGSTGSNSAPVITNKTPSERQVWENSEIGTKVGEPFTASDADGDTLTWSLSGTHAGLFSIEAGQITVAARIDREAYDSQLLSVTVTVSDGSDSDSVDVKVRMGNHVEPPDRPGAPSVSPSGTGLEVSWSVPGNDGPPVKDYDLHYRESGSASWADAGYDGTARSARIGGLKENTSYEVQVRAKNDDGESPWSTSGTGSTGVNRAPVITNKSPSDRQTIENIPEEDLPSLMSNPFEASDPDEDTLTWSLSGANADLFSIFDGQLATAVRLDHEEAEYRNVTVNVSDGEYSDSVDVKIRVGDMNNEWPLKPGTPDVSGASKTSLAVSWTAPDNTGRPSITGYDVELSRTTGGGYTRRSVTGRSTTSTTIAGLAEATSYQVRVRAKNDDGDGAWSEPGSGSTNANQAPVITNKTPSERQVDENSRTGTTVGDAFTATDANAEDTLTWSLSGTHASLFSIDDGQIKVNDVLDHEAAGTRSMTVNVSDGAASDSVAVLVTVIDVNEAPGKPDPPNATASTKTSLTMSWTAPANTGRPAITAYAVQYRELTDPTWRSHTHSNTETSAMITGLAEHTTYQVQVKAWNDEGGSAWSDPGTGRTEENAAPVIGNKPPDGALSVNENTSETLYTFQASDPDGDTITWTLSGTDDESFTISQDAAGDGVLVPASETTFDVETKDRYSFTVRASDGALSDSVTITLSVADVDEPPDAPDAPSVSGASKTSLAVSWDAPVNTGRPPINDYDVQYRQGTSGNWTAHAHNGDGTNTTIAGLEENASYEVQVMAKNDEGTSDWSPSGTGRTEENAAPVITNKPPNGALSVEENTTGTLYTFEASDADGDTITWTLSGTDQASFTISRNVAGNGVLAPASGTTLDFEGKASYSFTVRASDGALSDSVAITLSVTDDDTETPSGPDFGNATVPAQHWVVGSAIEPVTIPAATGGNGRLVYVASGLPTGVSLSADRTVVGTPAMTEKGTARVRVFDADNNTDTLNFDWTVAEDKAPDFGNVTVPAQHWVAGSAITSFTIPQATGGNAPLTYTATGLPAGVSLSEDLVVSGTPASTAARRDTATVRVRDVDGDTAVLSIAWTVDHPETTLIGARNKRLARAVLPRVGQALMAGPLRGVAARLTSLRQGTPAGFTYQVGGQSKLDALAMNLGQTLNQSQMDWRQLVGGSAFSLALTPAGQKNAGLRDVVLWGQGMYQHLANQGDATAETWKGGVVSAQLGMDARVHPLVLAGVLMNWGQGTMDWQIPGADAPGASTTGDFEVELTSVHPYVGWGSKDGAMEGWGTFGYGWGDVKTTEAQAAGPSPSSYLTLYSGAVGTTGRLLADATLMPGGTTTLRAKGDVSVVRMKVAETAVLEPLIVDTQRLRALLEVAHARALTGGGQVTPSLEVGLRHDGGAGPAGTGLETGMGLRYQQPAWGLTVDGQMRFLTLSSADYDEWGGSLQVQMVPRSTQEGAQASLTTGYGTSGNGIERLWTQDLPQQGGPGMGQGLGTARLAAEVGYGVAVGPLGSAGTTGVVVPYSGVTVTGAGARAFRIGGRLLWNQSGTLSLEGAQQEQALGITDHRLLLQGQWQF